MNIEKEATETMYTCTALVVRLIEKAEGETVQELIKYFSTDLIYADREEAIEATLEGCREDLGDKILQGKDILIRHYLVEHEVNMFADISIELDYTC